MKTKTDENEFRFSLRLPEKLHEQLVEIAKEESRSLNAQIVNMLQKSIKERGA
jgi:hypothetical protein